MAAVVAPMAATAALLAGASTGYADAVATTGPATSVTSTSAVLHGVALSINPTPTSTWVFEYGPTTAYGQVLKGDLIGLGLTALSATATGLAPGTTYHFRLVVSQGSSTDLASYAPGADATFTTAHGTVSLSSHRLLVHGGMLSLPVRCAGARATECKGTMTVIARDAHGVAMECGKATVTLSAGKHSTLGARVGGACVSRLRQTHGRALQGALFGSFSGVARLLTSVVTLIL